MCVVCVEGRGRVGKRARPVPIAPAAPLSHTLVPTPHALLQSCHTHSPSPSPPTLTQNGGLARVVQAEDEDARLLVAAKQGGQAGQPQPHWWCVCVQPREAAEGVCAARRAFQRNGA